MGSDIQKIRPNIQLPDYLKNKEVKGTEVLKKYVTLNRVKVIQKSARDELLSSFNVGDVICTPLNAMISPVVMAKGKPTKEGTPWKFVPLFFYVEYCTWNPIQLKGQGPTILARSFDPLSDLARKARDPQLRQEPHPNYPELKIRHVEHLNYIITPYEHPLAGEVMVLNYDRGNYYQGQKFSSLVTLRKASLFCCVFEASLFYNENEKGQWFSIQADNPSSGTPWVLKEEAEKFEELFEGFQKIHSEHRFVTQYEDDSDAVESDSASAPGEF